MPYFCSQIAYLLLLLPFVLITNVPIEKQNCRFRNTQVRVVIGVAVWPNWAIFESFWQKNCYCKSSPNIIRHFGLIWKRALWVKTAVATLWSTFGKIWAKFLFQHLVPLIGGAKRSLKGKQIFGISLLVNWTSNSLQKWTSALWEISELIWYRDLTLSNTRHWLCPVSQSR